MSGPFIDDGFNHFGCYTVVIIKFIAKVAIKYVGENVNRLVEPIHNESGPAQHPRYAKHL